MASRADKEGSRVLVVTPDAVITKTFQRLLEREGLEPTFATSANEAITKALRTHYGLIISTEALGAC